MRRPRYPTTGALAVILTLAMVAAVATAAGAGCGPVEYFHQVSSRATTAVAAAKRAGAERYAPYEMTAAEAYLHKAREEAGYAQYHDSIEYGRKAEEFANRARAMAATKMSQPLSGQPAPSSASSSPPREDVPPSGGPEAGVAPAKRSENE